jgi:hypothetical protein
MLFSIVEINQNSQKVVKPFNMVQLGIQKY